MTVKRRDLMPGTVWLLDLHGGPLARFVVARRQESVVLCYFFGPLMHRLAAAYAAHVEKVELTAADLSPIRQLCRISDFVETDWPNGPYLFLDPFTGRAYDRFYDSDVLLGDFVQRPLDHRVTQSTPEDGVAFGFGGVAVTLARKLGKSGSA